MKSHIDLTNFKYDSRRSSEEDGAVYSYSFPVLFYKKIPMIYATLYTCQNKTNELYLEVTDGSNLYGMWYESGNWGKNTTVAEIKKAISYKLLHMVHKGYGIVWKSNQLIEVQKDYGADKRRNNYR